MKLFRWLVRWWYSLEGSAWHWLVERRQPRALTEAEKDRIWSAFDQVRVERRLARRRIHQRSPSPTVPLKTFGLGDALAICEAANALKEQERRHD